MKTMLVIAGAALLLSACGRGGPHGPPTVVYAAPPALSAQAASARGGPHGPPPVLLAPATYPDMEMRIRAAMANGDITEGETRLKDVRKLRIQEATWRADSGGYLSKRQIKKLNQGYVDLAAGICDPDDATDETCPRLP